MSSASVIVSAVHEIEGSIEEWWNNNKSSLDNFEKNYDYNDEVEWRLSEGSFKSMCALEEFPVEVAYHSGRGEDVIEIILSEEYDMHNIKMTGLEDIIEEINNRMEPDFTLEVYYWYNGVDKPGGK